MNLGNKGEKTRAEIISCAKQLFYQRGYEATSFSDIVDATGLYRGNIYHYFKTKDDILQAVIAQHLVEFRALLSEWDSRHADPKSSLLAFVDMITGRRQDLVEYGCPVGTLNAELGKDRRDLQLAARALFDLFRDWLRMRFLELGKADAADALALHLLGRAQGIAMIAHVYQDTALLQREIQQLDAWIGQL
ncbi:MAG: helix-turn-helix domain containing protein [Sulfuriferula sp.]|nr:helix-turn-helix domain containing protein [Sulfuriferula sp.]